ncbi:hypothetical protein A9995_06090 [Erythrobacter sp. QSSC1-22B]|uniref:DUF924 family protein n=1 Tax=Erythrobacter sp. QSSC1-22B TaxID=1860125 RepID=UPI0008047D8B|nr:DUF924 family protein [Erythrobacter sp. QSSC1-22B]OBX19341.1 hypothetical protein A9995_06090 [Erythrobacter sp. QSSC1-22B]
MTLAHRPWAADLLYVWFNQLGPEDWFGGSPAVDLLLYERFERWLHALGRRPAKEFLGDAKTARAAILLFDQVPRNLYRGGAQAFAWDPLALELTHGMLARGWHRGLAQDAKQFLLMPLMHSEAIADQRLSLTMFARHAPASLSFARSHHTMIARFGRYPHRNEALGRSTTPAERRAIDAGFSW